MANIRNYTINDILKEQFKIRLGFKYYFTSIQNLFCFVILYFSFDDLTNFLGVYAFSCILGYRFLFNYTKSGQQFSPFFLKNLGKITRKIRNKANSRKAHKEK
ncbi:hypothetical protein ACOTVD_09080 [Campylobacter jejuni]|uniref:hypothetical protein n=1 Tax=Campylobacter jejuni TaxID=197 RepID=UPI00087459F8|nr:hypothetical protein [Campylobacter jejuni]EJF7467935.1 hypothetical protein [Campylobacter coli]EEU7470982.1 hypothetical protein [Campylobacter jejuni]MCW1355780.1 hypothetical protein [Campylobacter jejuni]OEV61783.1 hypothetical protein AJY73_10535 [Campylobacter jejuni]